MLELAGRLGEQELGLIVVGGDGTMSFAQKFIAKGATRFVGVPKTIDNDLWLSGTILFSNTLSHFIIR